MPLAVWKLGGSLFDLPDLEQRLRRLKQQHYSNVPVVIIPGGGAFADAVRRYDQLQQLASRQAHLLALDAMRMSARLVANVLGDASPLADPAWQEAQLITWQSQGDFATTLAVWDVISEWNRSVPDFQVSYGEFPEDWTLTSDSIAALLAAYWKADTLVLCKSIDKPVASDYQAWAEAGAVDPTFPTVARHVASIEWVNLRTY